MELRESILFQDGLLNEIMALRFQNMGKTTFLFNSIDDFSLKKTAECCYQIDGNGSYGYRRKKVSKKVFAS